MLGLRTRPGCQGLTYHRQITPLRPGGHLTIDLGEQPIPIDVVLRLGPTPTFRLARKPRPEATHLETDSAELALMLEGIELEGAKRRKRKATLLRQVAAGRGLEAIDQMLESMVALERESERARLARPPGQPLSLRAQ
jgi:hypothetical protein